MPARIRIRKIPPRMLAKILEKTRKIKARTWGKTRIKKILQRKRIKKSLPNRLGKTKKS